MFRANLKTAATTRLTDIAKTTLVLNIPERIRDLPGASRAPRGRVLEANDCIDEAVANYGLVLVDVRDLRGPRVLRPDRCTLAHSATSRSPIVASWRFAARVSRSCFLPRR